MKIIFFDGYCNLCNGLIDYLMKADRKHVLKFASLQGETAKQMKVGALPNIDPETVIYLRDGVRYEKSTAILKIFEDLGGLRSAAKVFFIFPSFFRDSLYKLTAKNRYRLFGKLSTCRLPTESEREQFLP